MGVIKRRLPELSQKWVALILLVCSDPQKEANIKQCELSAPFLVPCHPPFFEPCMHVSKNKVYKTIFCFKFDFTFRTSLPQTCKVVQVPHLVFYIFLNYIIVITIKQICILVYTFISTLMTHSWSRATFENKHRL